MLFVHQVAKQWIASHSRLRPTIGFHCSLAPRPQLDGNAFNVVAFDNGPERHYDDMLLLGISTFHKWPFAIRLPAPIGIFGFAKRDDEGELDTRVVPTKLGRPRDWLMEHLNRGDGEFFVHSDLDVQTWREDWLAQ